MQICLSSHFIRHLVETLNRIRYAVYRFETFTYDPVDHDPGKFELQTNSVNPATGPKVKGGAHTGSDAQDILPLATRQCCFCPLS
jgi:hypothetical protein